MKRAVKKIKQRMWFSQWFSGEEEGRMNSLPPGGLWQHLGGIFACHNWRVMLPASSGLRPGKLLHILGCKGQLPVTKNDLTPHVYRTEIEKPWSRGAGSRDHSRKASWGRWQGS